ncbi:FAD-dependent oxidoreductase [Cystobacter fuscus]|uniref:FAD-dependent oxidoreductase n=1 Tax=Cystobacter fuscus TaxID=43 RepID=UPI002B2F5A35|nr:FAD-dependent oxidoreductase [Cystobacter fuscus]
MRVIVLGGGVSGLSCGVRLLEAGYPVDLWARELSPNTTSDVAAAIWYPYRAFPQERVTRWGARTFEVLCELARQPATGVRCIPGLELRREPAADPWWRPCVARFRHATAEELLSGYVDGFVFEVPVIDMSRYLPYLMERFRGLGGRVVQREVRSLEEAWAESDLVVNCTGLGSRSLVGDTSLFPIRGQVVRVAPLGEPRFLLDEDETRGMTYVIPREEECILGGTAEEGRASLEPEPAQAEAILERAARLLPTGTRLRVLGHRVGLRPGRPSVRLEVERHGGRLVLHDYGHGGAGVTLSWGCAEEGVSLLARARRETAHVGPVANPSITGSSDGT